jgi:hypothetical protein
MINKVDRSTESVRAQTREMIKKIETKTQRLAKTCDNVNMHGKIDEEDR